MVMSIHFSYFFYSIFATFSTSYLYCEQLPICKTVYISGNITLMCDVWVEIFSLV